VIKFAIVRRADSCNSRYVEKHTAGIQFMYTDDPNRAMLFGTSQGALQYILMRRSMFESEKGLDIRRMKVIANPTVTELTDEEGCDESDDC
jgi:hypothetical protein